MEEKSRHITSKVVIGYMLLILLAVGSVAYIYKTVEQMAAEDASDSLPRQKTYLITRTLSLLYESETVAQLLGMPQDELRHFNRTLDLAHRNMDTLRTLVTDSFQWMKIDTIDLLLEHKRVNMHRLLETWKESSAERLYTENIEKIIAVQDSAFEEVTVPEQVEIKQDTVIVPRKPKGFFRRLADAFSPARIDTGIVVTTSVQTVSDTLVNLYNPSDTIVSILKSIQDSVAGRQEELHDRLAERAATLRYNNSVITRRINQLLRDIEQEEMDTSLDRMMKKQELMRRTSRLIGGIAGVSVVIVVVFLLLIARDVSRSKYYRKQLEKAKQYAENLLRSREKLILTISHDIRAPLSSVIGYIELLLRRHPDERQRYFLENMKGSSDHILSLVNDLLDFQRLEAGEMEIHRIPFRVDGLFHEIYTSFKPLAENKGLQFVLNLKEGVAGRALLGDPMRIRQILGNLLSNAIKFTREGRIVIVVGLSSSSTDPDSCRLSVVVSDTGPGIALAEQEKIFGEFTRLSGTEETEGFGLGLSITRKLIALMGGDLVLQSVPGKGSDFIVTLPFPVAEGHLSAPTEADSRVTESLERKLPVFEGGAVRCLLVDDDPLQLALTEELLKQSQVEVTVCADPLKVTDLLQHTVFDVVITDIQMPGCDGYRLLKRIRESHVPGADTVPVIALSASLVKEPKHYLEAGFAGFLNKPFTAARLISLLNELLTTRLEAKTELDFSSLTAFAGEDKEASASILRTFREETGKSIALLEKALQENDRNTSVRLSHKLIPLFTMLGANSLVQHLRILEKDDAELTDAGWRNLLAEVIRQAASIIAQAVPE